MRGLEVTLHKYEVYSAWHKYEVYTEPCKLGLNYSVLLQLRTWHTDFFAKKVGRSVAFIFAREHFLVSLQKLKNKK